MISNASQAVQHYVGLFSARLGCVPVPSPIRPAVSSRRMSTSLVQAGTPAFISHDAPLLWEPQCKGWPGRSSGRPAGHVGVRRAGSPATPWVWQTNPRWGTRLGSPGCREPVAEAPSRFRLKPVLRRPESRLQAEALPSFSEAARGSTRRSPVRREPVAEAPSRFRLKPVLRQLWRANPLQPHPRRADVLARLVHAEHRAVR